MEKLDNEYVCCICGKTFNGYGNNRRVDMKMGL